MSLEGGREGREGREGRGWEEGGEGRGGGREGGRKGGRAGGKGREGGRGGRDACYTYSNKYVHSLSPRHDERNYVSRSSIVSRRTRVRNYVRRDVE